MKKLRFTQMLLVFFSAVFFITSCTERRSDGQIQQDVVQMLSADQNNRQAYANVTTTVNEGVVTLDGQCEGDNCGDSVTAKINEVVGVKSVINNLQQIDTPTDYTLRTSVQSIISKYQGVQADVAGGIVVLRGTIQREQIQPLINELSTLKAKKLDNQLAIQ